MAEHNHHDHDHDHEGHEHITFCLLYTSDAADE